MSLERRFKAWRSQVHERTRHRHANESIDEMDRLGLIEIGVDESQIQITDADRDIDYLSDLFESMLYLRNHYVPGGNHRRYRR